MADTNYSSDSFDSDWNSSIASPYSPSSAVNLSDEYADPAESNTPCAIDHSQLVNTRKKRSSLDSQGSHYDPSYSSVEVLGGGFSSFGPLPPVEFRSTPIEERDADSNRQESRLDTANSSDHRKSFTNELFKAIHNPKDVDLGEGGTSYEGFQEKDISGMENQGYDSDEELNEQLANSLAKPSTSDVTSQNLEELYAKVDKSKKKKSGEKDASSSSDTESNHSITQAPSKLNDLHAKPDKSKKTFRKKSLDPQGNQASVHVGEPGHDSVVVYDERTNL